uniref:Ycf1 n=1 Tax=Rhododendron calophytum TaxID=479660 RepID=UPI001F1317A7|nr:Ycf1 [Rhododendron calophytum]YP_010296500.1 hypothetical protein RF1 [Rhododendron calophytum]UMB51795.1 Ycf1 [Rhododendron calophytum]UMB51827.1 hypothetical protein RF1 [Rhododendron calophytum]
MVLNSHKAKHNFWWDWMEMNEDTPISNLESWFFPQLVLFFNAYKPKSWFIPSKLLLLTFPFYRNKRGSYRKTKYKNLKKRKKEEEKTKKEKPLAGDATFFSFMRRSRNSIKETEYDKYTRKFLRESLNDVPTPPKFADKYRYKIGRENLKRKEILQELFFFQRHPTVLEEYVGLRTMFAYNTLFKLKDPLDFFSYAIERKKINVKGLTRLQSEVIKIWSKRGLMCVEPLRLSVTNNSQFIMYQIIAS